MEFAFRIDFAWLSTFFQIWGFARNFNGNFLVFSIGFAGISQEFKGISRYFLSFFFWSKPVKTSRSLIKANQVDQVFPDQNPSKQADH